MKNPFTEGGEEKKEEVHIPKRLEAKGGGAMVGKDGERYFFPATAEWLVEEYKSRKGEDENHELLQDLYWRLFRADKPRLFEEILAEDGVPPSPEFVRAIENRIVDLMARAKTLGDVEFLHAKRFALEWLHAMNVAPSGELVQRCYRKIFENAHDWDQINMVVELMTRKQWPGPDAETTREYLRHQLALDAPERIRQFFSRLKFRTPPTEDLSSSWKPEERDKIYRILFSRGRSTLMKARDMIGDVEPEVAAAWLRNAGEIANGVDAYRLMLETILLAHRERMAGWLKELNMGLRTLSPSVYDEVVPFVVNRLGDTPVDDRSIEEAVRVPWTDVLARMKKIQARSKNEEYDPWEHQLDPLVLSVEADGLISREKEEDGEFVENFVKRYGMNNMPNVFRWFVWTSRAKTMDDLTDEQKKEMAEGLGIKVGKFNNKGQLHVELKRMQEEIRISLLADRIPKSFERAPVATWELFNAMKSMSKWERDDDSSGMVASLEKWQKEKPEATVLPEGYERVRVEVRTRNRRVELDVQQAQNVFCRELDDDRTFWEQALSMMNLLRGLREESKVWSAIPRHWRDAALKLSAKINEKEFDINPDLLREMRSFLLDYLEEHYLHPSQEAHRTGHDPFDDAKLAALRKAWGLDEPNSNPILAAYQKMDDIRRVKEIEGEMKGAKGREPVAIDFVPVRGLLRVYAGDVGDACYTSQHKELAEGEYPGITAYMIVQGGGSSQERLAGSFLVVEARTQTGELALVVRANNPRQNLLADVDAKAFVQSVMEQMSALAKHRDIKYVAVPIDSLGASSSNREDVSGAYRALYGGRERIGLQSTPETNFNGYDVWNANGDHACAVVWKAEDGG